MFDNGPRSGGMVVGAAKGEDNLLADSGVLIAERPSCREDDEIPDAVLRCIDCGRSGEEGMVGRAEGVRKGTCLNVEDFREDDSDDSTGLGLGPGDP